MKIPKYQINSVHGHVEYINGLLNITPIQNKIVEVIAATESDAKWIFDIQKISYGCDHEIVETKKVGEVEVNDISSFQTCLVETYHWRNEKLLKKHFPEAKLLCFQCGYNYPQFAVIGSVEYIKNKMAQYPALNKIITEVKVEDYDKFYT